jgi:hypothetical protein
MTLGKKHLWTKVSLVKALVNWGPRVGVPAEHHDRVLAERALRLFPPRPFNYERRISSRG